MRCMGSQSDSAGIFNVIAALQDSGIVKTLNSLVFLGKGRTSLHVYIVIKNIPGSNNYVQQNDILVIELKTIAKYFQFHRQNIIQQISQITFDECICMANVPKGTKFNCIAYNIMQNVFTGRNVLIMCDFKVTRTLNLLIWSQTRYHLRYEALIEFTGLSKAIYTVVYSIVQYSRAIEYNILLKDPV